MYFSTSAVLPNLAEEHIANIEYADTPETALDGAIAALVVTDWPEISAPDAGFDAKATPVVIDGRRDGIVYERLT